MVFEIDNFEGMASALGDAAGDLNKVADYTSYIQGAMFGMPGWEATDAATALAHLNAARNRLQTTAKDFTQLQSDLNWRAVVARSAVAEARVPSSEGGQQGQGQQAVEDLTADAREAGMTLEELLVAAYKADMSPREYLMAQKVIKFGEDHPTLMKAGEAIHDQANKHKGPLNLVVSILPGSGNVIGAQEAISGRNPITGERIGTGGRIFSGVTAIPGLGNVVKIVGRGGEAAVKGGKAAISSGIKGGRAGDDFDPTRVPPVRRPSEDYPNPKKGPRPQDPHRGDGPATPASQRQPTGFDRPSDATPANLADALKRAEKDRGGDKHLGAIPSVTRPISPQKQAGHIRGTPQYNNRIKAGKPTSAFSDASSAERLTADAWQRGKPVPGRPNVRDYDFGRPIGTGPNGGTQTRVRVHIDKQGRIHGHPSGPETSRN
jgi:hypothetical protein